MPSVCSVIGCSNKHGRDKKSFYRLPKEITHQDEKTRHLSKTRREIWLTNINRKDIKPASYGNLRICSDHFVSGGPSALYDDTNPDWAPTLKMGHNKLTKSGKQKSKLRSLKEKKEEAEAASALLNLQKHAKQYNKLPLPEQKPGLEVQTTIDMNSLTLMESELFRLRLENAELMKRVLYDDYSEEYFRRDVEKIEYYTGILDFKILMSIYQRVEPCIPDHEGNILTKFQQLVLALMKLRLDLSIKDLAYRFKILKNNASEIFLSMIDAMYSSKLMRVKHNRNDYETVKQKYIFLGGSIPLNYLEAREENGCTILEKIVEICCVLSTYCFSIVKLHDL